MSVLQADTGKIAMDIAKKTADMAKTTMQGISQNESVGKIAEDIAKKTAQSTVGKITQIVQDAGQSLGK